MSPSQTPDILQRPREALTRYSQGFLSQRTSPSAPLKGRPDSGDVGGTEPAPEPTEKRRSKSCERPRERSDSDERIDRELKNLIVQMKEGMECPEPLVVNFDDKEGVPAESLPAESFPGDSTADDSKEGGNGSGTQSGNGNVKRNESLTKLGKRIGAWMKGEPKGIPSVPVSRIHIIDRTPEKLEAGSVTDADDDRSSMMGDSERSVGSSAVAQDPQGFRVWAWLRTAAHPDARSVVSEPDAAEMRASDQAQMCASDPEMGEAYARAEGDSSGEASFWKKRIFGRSLSTMTFNSPPKDGAQEEQRQQLRPSWAAVSY